MLKFLKTNKYYLLIFALGIFLRFYQLETRTNFTADQGRDYLLVRQLITDHRLTLLGPKASIGDFFFGPLYYYLLLPALVFGNYDPLAGAVMTVFFDSLALLLFSYFFRSPFASLLYATFPLLVNLVRIPLNPFVTPFFAILFYGFLRSSSLLAQSFLPGLFAGLLFQLHFSTAPLILLGFLWQIKSPAKLLSLGSYITGLFIGITPMLLFEIRHQFFNTAQFWHYLSSPQAKPGLSEHYFLYLLPLLFLLIARLRWIIFPLIIINLWLILKPVDNGYLMSKGWNLTGIRQAAATIAADNPPQKFEVAATLDGDTRALPYRYLLEAKYNLKPLSVEAYPQAQALYIITRDPADKIITSPVWEVSSLMPASVFNSWELKPGIYLHKIIKQ